MPPLFQPFPMLAGRRAQVWRHQPACRRPRHFHDEPELNVVVAGRGVLGVGAHRIEVGAGETLLFQPGQDHELLEASEDFDRFVLALSPELVERSVGYQAIASSRSLPFVAPQLCATAAELAELALLNARSERDEATVVGDYHDGAAVECRIADVFASALREAPTTHLLTRHALQTARAQPGLSNGALALKVGSASSSISRQFHEEVGVPLVVYRARLKLMRFIALVDAGHELTRASLDAHFGSYSQCHRVFRRALGCSPRQYFAGHRRLIDAATVL